MRLIKKWNMGWIALCVAAMLMAGCGGGGGSSSSAPAPTTGSLKVDNSGSTFWIDEAYVALSTSTSWGTKQNTNAIAPGSTWTLSSITPGTYDARGVSIGTYSTYYTYSYGFPITAGATYTLTTSDTGYTGSMLVTNNNPTYSITALYIATGGYGTTNVLSTPISPYTTREIVNIPPNDFYYVRAVQNGLNRDNYPVQIISHGYTPISYN